ncbi:hypothetical protein Ddc_03760 [Ditylenchus destructor]|nr:hypothetical protein Ddc_03760 [Ditylenchus destructor]
MSFNRMYMLALYLVLIPSYTSESKITALESALKEYQNSTNNNLYSYSLVHRLRGGFYRDLAVHLKNDTCRIIKSLPPLFKKPMGAVAPIEYLPAMRCFPNDTTHTRVEISNHYHYYFYEHMRDFDPFCESIVPLPVKETTDMTSAATEVTPTVILMEDDPRVVHFAQEGRIKISIALNNMAEFLANKLRQPIQIVPGLMLMSTATKEELKNAVSLFGQMANDKSPKDSLPLITGFVGFAHFSEGFYPGMFVFMHRIDLEKKECNKCDPKKLPEEYRPKNNISGNQTQ